MSPNASIADLPGHDRRQWVRAWVEHPRVQNLIIALILVNAALLGLETTAIAYAFIVNPSKNSFTVMDLRRVL
jgi:hypothetical protein